MDLALFWIDSYNKIRVSVLSTKLTVDRGPARNLGVEQARGKYIGFVDSDDWVEQDMFQILYARAEQTCSDMVFTGFKTMRDNTIIDTREQSSANMILSNATTLFEYRKHYYGIGLSRVDQHQVPGYVWSGIYRRKFLIDKQLRFQNMMGEDQVFLIRSFQVAQRVAFVSGAPYCYRRDGQVSSTNSFQPKTLQSYIANMYAVRDLLRQEQTSREYYTDCLFRWYRHVIDLSRELVHRIVESSLSSADKSRYIRQTNMNPLLIEACSHYSWRYLPPKFVPMYWCQKNNIVWAERLMMEFWQLISR